MTKKIKQVLRIVFIIASISSLWFVPWPLVKAWCTYKNIPEQKVKIIEGKLGSLLHMKLGLKLGVEKDPWYLEFGRNMLLPRRKNYKFTTLL